VCERSTPKVSAVIAVGANDDRLFERAHVRSHLGPGVRVKNEPEKRTSLTSPELTS